MTLNGRMVTFAGSLVASILLILVILGARFGASWLLWPQVTG